MTPLSELAAQAAQWRRALHQHPEIGFQEHRTAQFIRERLQEWGISVSQPIGQTGIVGIISHGEGARIGLRADMDALPMAEANTFAHASQNTGVMHACGHDGHTAILLAAAQAIAQRRDQLQGTVYFIFQPAEEMLGGANAMLANGLLTQYPMDFLYGIHNWPGLPLGEIAVREGAMMGSYDDFDITLSGQGGHAAMPQRADDVILASAALIQALQSIVARRLDPQDAAVLSITQIHAGDAHNILPAQATIGGTVRAFDMAVRQKVEDQLRHITQQVAATYQLTADVVYRALYPVTLNHPEAAQHAARAAARVVGADKVRTQFRPSAASEDFACLLQHVRGAYCWLGVDGVQPSRPLHHPEYDFNDAAIETGIRFYLSLVEEHLMPEAA